MKNEVLARAITGIDDELILSAHRPSFSKRKIIKQFSVYAAACLIFVCGILFLSRSNSDPEILTNGTAVSAQPVTVVSPDARQTYATPDDITVSLEIVSHRDLTVTATDGRIKVYSAQTNERIDVGRSCKTKGPVTVQWRIEKPDRSRTYEIQINGRETVLILQYEQTTEQWIIRKSED